MAAFKLLKLHRYPILDQLFLEEKLLRCTKNNYLLINQGTPSPSIIMGISGKPYTLLDVEKAKKGILFLKFIIINLIYFVFSFVKYYNDGINILY